MSNASVTPPIAKQIDYKIKNHGDEINDKYHWLRDDKWPKVQKKDVLKYLRDENEYTNKIMKPFKPLQDKIFKELKGRIKEEDQSWPVEKEGYFYYTRMEKGANYPVYCRKHGSMKSKEEIFLDVNKLAGKHVSFSMGALSISPDHNFLLYSEDTKGKERFTAKIKDLRNNKNLEDKVENTIGNITWHEDGKGFFYSLLNDKWRSDKVYYHKLGTKQSEDKLLYEEKDITFRVGVSKSSSKKYILVSASSSTSSEKYYLNMDSKDFQPKLIEKRKEDHLYGVDERDGKFYIRTNDKGKNFRLVTVDTKDPSYKNWQEILSHSDEKYFTDFDLYKNHMAIVQRIKGINHIKVIDFNNKEEHSINFPEEAYAAGVMYTTYDASFMRLAYSSMTTPSSVIEYDFKTKKMYTRKTQEIPSGYEKDQYKSERVFAKSKDGTLVPISLVYKKSMIKQGENPLLLYGYGSYGISMSAGFRTSIISLLDRGFIYAIAHVRGGDDLGYKWYEDAKFLNKKRTFDDFISCAEFLIDKKYTSKGNIVIKGGSAGGMLVGVAVNEAPELFKSAVALVPFVDVLNTMLDENLPLTPGEFKEWGNPKDKKYYDYIKSYSPYDNVKKQDYPQMLVTAGLTDPRVTYWEPAKWVAKLRAHKTGNNLLLLKTEMESGHAGKSGRFRALEEVAFIYSFILKSFNLTN